MMVLVWELLISMVKCGLVLNWVMICVVMCGNVLILFESSVVVCVVGLEMKWIVIFDSLIVEVL